MSTKLSAFVSMNTTSTAAPNASGSSLAVKGSLTNAAISVDPTSGKKEYVPRLIVTGSHPRQSSAASTSTDAVAMATAGAGPRSAMASTSARNEPDIRTPRTSTVSASLPTARTRSSSTSSIGCQSVACELDVLVANFSDV